MNRNSTRQPRRIRALLVTAALGASLFASALPAAAASSQLLVADDTTSVQGFTWVRGGTTTQGFTWVR